MLLAIVLATACVTGSDVPAVASSQPAKLTEVNIDSVIPKAPKRPDYDTEVLQPLRAAQQKAAEEAAQAAQAAQSAAAAAVEKQRQAELEAQSEVQVSQAPVVAPVTVSGSCSQWLSAAGITDIANAMFIISHESGCNPNAVNPSSGACGIGQALPCGKTGCAMGDGQCQMNWMNSYVLSRYGSWANAAAFWRGHSWY